MKLGEKYWCIKGSMDDRGLSKPWLGMVTFADGDTCFLSAVCADGKPDTDENATAICRANEIFGTEADAFAAWEVARLSLFAEEFSEVERLVHKNAREHGWRDAENEDDAVIALLHSEVYEVMDALRRGNPASERIPKFGAVEEELADIVIRCMDWSAKKGYRLAEAIVAKHLFNKNRPHEHDGKPF